MIPDSIFTRGLIYSFSLIQAAVAPFSSFYYIYYLTTEQKLFTIHKSIDVFVHYWLGSELVFYLFFLITRNRMQRLLPTNAPNAKERSDLYYLCISNIDDAQTWLSEWFILANNEHPDFEEIHRDNVAEWLSWAFFSSPLEDVLQDDSLVEELNYMMDNFEEKFQLQFNLGYNEDVVAYRINFDPIHAYHRPFAFYAVIMFFTALFNFAFQFYFGMKKYGPDNRSSIWSLLEPEQSYNSVSNINLGPEKVSYWFRDGDRSKKPIVFIHGIGAGLMCYMTFLIRLMSLDGPIICIELPYVSMHCTEDVPSMQETIIDLKTILKRHDFKEAVFVAHSLGTAIASWVVKHMSNYVAGIVFLDPICFMLHYKDVCSNFVYRTPKTAAQGLVKYFASTELYISYYISRHFHWYQSALFVKPNITHHHHTYTISVQMPKKTKVFLSEKDNIVDSLRVDTYLNQNSVDCTVMKDLDHALFLFHPSWQNQIVETVKLYV